MIMDAQGQLIISEEKAVKKSITNKYMIISYSASSASETGIIEK